MAAYRVQCASNLHQIGVALTLYVDDYNKYPAFGDTRRRGTPADARSVFWDAKILEHAGKSKGIFVCRGLPRMERLPANLWPDPNKGLLTDTWSITDREEVLWPNRSYGYNGAGVGLVSSPGLMRGWPLGLGLDPMLENYPDTAQVLFRGASSVVVPSEMVAVVDYNPVHDDDYDGDFHPDAIYSLTLAGSRHRGRANVMFCDTRVEYMRTNRLTLPSSRAWWNYDHQEHGEAKLYFPPCAGR